MTPLTPYAYHHVIEALLHVGEKELALSQMRTYWGGMTALGADTFWEAFDPETAIRLMIDEIKNFDMQVFLAFMKAVHKDDQEKERRIEQCS